MREEKAPLISVIVPVYRAEKYLHRCVDSLLSQTFPDFEVLLVDDGSPDRSGEICDEYAKKDSRVRVFHKENGGVGSARNLGIANALGKWCCFVDSDDYVFSGYLLSLVCNAHSTNVLYVGRSYYIKYRFKDSLVLSGLSSLSGLNISYGENWEKSEIYHLIHMPWNKLFSMEIIREINLQFPSNLSIGEDHIFVLNYLLSSSVFGLTFIKCESYVYFMDENPNSLIRQYYNPYIDFLFYVKEIRQSRIMLICKYGIDNHGLLEFFDGEYKSYLIRALISLCHTGMSADSYKKYQYIVEKYLFQYKGVPCSPNYGTRKILGYIVDYFPVSISFYVLPVVSGILRAVIYFGKKILSLLDK